MATASAQATADYRSTVLADNPDSYFRMDDANATMVNQVASGNGSHVGNPSLGVTGALAEENPNRAVTYETHPNTDHSRFQVSDTGTYTQFSIEYFVWTGQEVANAGPEWYHGAGLVDGEVTGVTSDAGTSLMPDGKVAFGMGNPDRTIRSTTVVNNGQWHHVVATANGSGSMKLYVDGVLETEISNGPTGARSNSHFTVGAIDTQHTQAAAIIDEVAFYRHELTAGEVTEHFAAAEQGENLLVNGNAEADPGAPNSTTTDFPFGWVSTGSFSSVKYDDVNGFPTTNVSDSIGGQDNFFAGGPGAFSTARQVIDVSGQAAEIDAGRVTADLSAYLGGFGTQADNMRITTTFWRAGESSTTGFLPQLGPVTPGDRSNQTTLLQRETTGAVPPGTREISVTMIATHSEGAYNDGYADNVRLTLDVGPPPQGTVTIGTTGGGTGRITGPGINCVDAEGATGDCTESYAVGTAVTLTPQPDPDSRFPYFFDEPGPECLFTPTCSFTVKSGSRFIGGVFHLKSQPLGSAIDGSLDAAAKSIAEKYGLSVDPQKKSQIKTPDAGLVVPDFNAGTVGAVIGTAIPVDEAKLLGSDGASLIGSDGASLTSKATKPTSLIGSDGASLIGSDGASLIGSDGATLVGNGGNTLVGNGGNTRPVQGSPAQRPSGNERKTKYKVYALGGYTATGLDGAGNVQVTFKLTKKGEQIIETFGNMNLQLKNAQEAPLKVTMLEVVKPDDNRGAGGGFTEFKIG